jgi:AAA15 family ATPase/GTPase
MIVSFSVGNFRSFATEETFSLVASNRFTGHLEGHAVPIPGSDEKVLRSAVLYGANGAGKSNLFRALSYVETMVLQPREKNSGTGREAFRFGSEHEQPSSFDLRFVADDRLYRFGLKVDDQRITEEWLVWVDGGRERVIYERTTDPTGKVNIEAEGLKAAGEKLAALATVGGPQNQTFLATVRATLNSSDCGNELLSVLTWFDHKLRLVKPNSSFLWLGEFLAADPRFLEFASEFLNSASTGVDHLEVRKEALTEDQLRVLIPADRLSSVLKDLQQGGVIRLGEDRELLIERTDRDHVYLLTIQSAHQHQAGQTVPLELAEESDGTRRLLHLIPALHKLKTGDGVFFVDEIDRSMHPMLVWKFLEFFLKSCKGAQGQLIVTTHESNLLDLELLRRDEIWFAEKDQSGATRLYSLADFKVRKDLEIRKHYLQGRFGAVPFLGNLDRLLMDEEVPA